MFFFLKCKHSFIKMPFIYLSVAHIGCVVKLLVLQYVNQSCVVNPPKAKCEAEKPRVCRFSPRLHMKTDG